MAEKSEIYTFRGKFHYAKVLGDPVPNYNKDGLEWKIDVEFIDQNTAKEFKKLGIGDRVKNKENYLDGADYASFKAKYNEKRSDEGRPNVVDRRGKPWPQDELIGNETVGDIRIAVVDYGKGLKKGVYIRGIRVLDHVPYIRDVFEPLEEDDEYYSPSDDDDWGDPEEAKEVDNKKRLKDDDEDLDDDIPF